MNSSRKVQYQHRTPRGESLVSLLFATVLMTIAASVVLSMFVINTQAASSFWNKGDTLSSATLALRRLTRLVRSARCLGDVYGTAQNTTTQSLNLNYPKNQQTIAMVNNNITTSNVVGGTAFLVSPVFPSIGDPYYVNSSGKEQLPSTMYGGVFPWTQSQSQWQLPGTETATSNYPGYPGGGGVGGSGTPFNPANSTSTTYGGGEYALAQDTLIVQVPVFVDSNGLDPQQETASGQQFVWPASWNGATAGGTNGAAMACDTYVFRVLPDSNYPGTYMMQEAVFPANPNGNQCFTGTIDNNTPSTTFNGHPTNIAANLNLSTPTTIVRGIVGPLDTNGNISVFSYVERNINGTGATTFTSYPCPLPLSPPPYVTDYTGVIINLEILSNQEGTRGSVGHFKTECYFRNNTQINQIGAPLPS